MKGHSGDPMNDLVDRLAVEAALTQQARTGDEPDPTRRRSARPTTSAPAAADGAHAAPTDRRRRRPQARRCSGTARPSSAATTPTRCAERAPAGWPRSSRPRRQLHPDLVVLTGLRLGAEQLGAEAAVDAGVPFVAVLPYPDPDRRGRRRARRHFAELLDAAPATSSLLRADGAAERSSRRARALARRDAWLARNADEAVLVWDGEDAGARRRCRSLEDHLGDDVWVDRPVTSSPTVSRVGVDTGGTFTDVVADDGGSPRCSSTPDDPGRGRAAGVASSAGAGERRRCWPTARRSPPTRCSSGGARASRWSRTTGFADVIEIARQDRPSLYDPCVDRPDAARRRASCRLEVDGRLDADGAELEPVDPTRCRDARRRRGGRGVPAARRPRTRRTSGRSAPRCAARAIDVTVLARGVARVPRVRADGHDGRQRLPAARVPRRTSPASPTLRRRGAGDDVGRRAGAGRRARPTLPAALLLSGPAGGVRAGGRGRGGVRLPRRGHLRHGRHEHRRVPGPRRRARAGAERARRRASRSGCRRSTSTPSAPAAARSPASTPAARSSSGPRAPGAEPGPGLLRPGRHRADGDRRRPGRSAASRPTPRSPASGALDVDAAAALRSTRPASTADGRGRGGRRGDGAGGARGVGRAGRRPARPRAGRLRRRRAAARLRAGRRARHGRGDRAAPRPACCRPSGCCARRRQRELVRSWPTPARPRRRSTTRCARWRAEARGARCGGATPTVDDGGRLPLPGQSHELTVPRSTTSPPSTSAATATRARARRSRSSPLRATAPRRRRRSTSTDLPGAGARRGAGPGGRRRARLHDLGARRAGRAEPVAAGALRADARCERADEPRPGRAAGPDLPADRRGRGDGRGAAAGRVQPEHQGAGRLLGRAVHRRRRAAGAGRAHPRAPRLDAGVGARPPSTRSATRLGARRPGRSSTTRSPAAPTSTTSPSSPRASSTTAARRLGGQPGPPRRRRRHGAGLDPAPTRPRSTRRACASRRCGSRPRCEAIAARQLAHARTSGAATSTRRSAPTWSASTRLAAARPARRSTRSSTTASGACGPRWPTLPDGAWQLRRTCSTRTGPRARPAAAGRASR